MSRLSECGERDKGRFNTRGRLKVICYSFAFFLICPVLVFVEKPLPCSGFMIILGFIIAPGDLKTVNHMDGTFEPTSHINRLKQ